MTDGEEFRCHRMILPSFSKVSGDPHDGCEQQVEKDAGCQRKVEPKILTFTGKSTS